MTKMLTRGEAMREVNKRLIEKKIPGVVSWWNGPSEEEAAKEFIETATDSLKGVLENIKKGEAKPVNVFIRYDERTEEPYIVVQFSWGRPNHEFRVFFCWDGPLRICYIEYAYLDRFTGVGILVDMDRAKELKEFITFYEIALGEKIRNIRLGKKELPW